MFRRTFIRLTFFVLTAMATLLILSASHSRTAPPASCHIETDTDSQAPQGDLFLPVSLSQALLISKR